MPHEWRQHVAVSAMHTVVVADRDRRRTEVRGHLLHGAPDGCGGHSRAWSSPGRGGWATENGEHCNAPGPVRTAHPRWTRPTAPVRSEEHTSELQSRGHLVCRLLLEKKKAPTSR